MNLTSQQQKALTFMSKKTERTEEELLQDAIARGFSHFIAEYEREQFLYFKQAETPVTKEELEQKIDEDLDTAKAEKLARIEEARLAEVAREEARLSEESKLEEPVREELLEQV